MKLAKTDPRTRECAQYVTKGGKRVPCDLHCVGFYCERHGGSVARRQLQAIGKKQ